MAWDFRIWHCLGTFEDFAGTRLLIKIALEDAAASSARVQHAITSGQAELLRASCWVTVFGLLKPYIVVLFQLFVHFFVL